MSSSSFLNNRVQIAISPAASGRKTEAKANDKDHFSHSVMSNIHLKKRYLEAIGFDLNKSFVSTKTACAAEAPAFTNSGKTTPPNPANARNTANHVTHAPIDRNRAVRPSAAN
jgi:hypothetical protein